MRAFFRILSPSSIVPEGYQQGVSICNILSFFFGIITITLLLILYFLFGWPTSTPFILLTVGLFGSIPAINSRFYNLGRLLFCLAPVYLVLFISIYIKLASNRFSDIVYYDSRFIILASTILPVLVFKLDERLKLLVCLGSTFLALALFDPIHYLFGVDYFQRGFLTKSYYYINYIALICFIILLLGVITLKLISQQAEQRVKYSIDQINSVNEQLLHQNEELVTLNHSMSLQSEELLRQKKEIHESRELLAEANLLISRQQEKLFQSNQQLAKLVEEKSADLLRTNEELVRHNNELRQFSYTVSHNLRGPVARLLGLTDLFGRLKDDTERLELGEMIQRSGRELDEVLKDLTLIIDLRNDLYQVREKIVLEEEWKRTQSILQEQIRPMYKLMVDFKHAPHVYSIRAMIQSILYNLVSNAIKYRNPERDLEIFITSAQLSDQSVLISVKDNGLGINLESQRDNMFKLYRRFHTHVDGKGLGLYLVKTQVDTLGGSIKVESEINQGTTFMVLLPHPKDVSKQIFFESQAAEIYYHADVNNTVIVWKKSTTGPEYQRAFQTVLHSLKTYRTPGWIADLRLQGVVPDEDQYWFLSTVIPEAVRFGLKRIAAIGFTDPIRKNYYDRMIVKTRNEGIELRVFETMEDAVKWMRDFIK